jgi:DNA-binding NarL/FixJ family response regulator
MRSGRPLAPVSISEQDRLQLVAWTRRAKTGQALPMRSRIILLAAEGINNKVIAARLNPIPHT